MALKAFPSPAVIHVLDLLSYSIPALLLHGRKRILFSTYSVIYHEIHWDNNMSLSSHPIQNITFHNPVMREPSSSWMCRALLALMVPETGVVHHGHNLMHLLLPEKTMHSCLLKVPSAGLVVTLWLLEKGEKYSQD